MTPSTNQKLALEKKHPLAIRWFHWINFPVLLIMIWSGISIYWANDVYRLGWGSLTLFRFFPKWVYDLLLPKTPLATGMAWHFLFMWIFVLNGFFYVAFLLLSKQYRFIVPGRGVLREALNVVLRDLRIRKEPLPKGKFNGAQKIAYSTIIVMGFGSCLTGLAIYKPVQFAWLTAICGGYDFARVLHFGLTIGFIVFILIHLLQVIRAGWNNFRAMVTGYELTTDTSQEAAQ